MALTFNPTSPFSCGLAARFQVDSALDVGAPSVRRFRRRLQLRQLLDAPYAVGALFVGVRDLKNARFIQRFSKEL